MVSIKKRLREWLRITQLENTSDYMRGVLAEQDIVNSQVACAHDRLHNMYDSNRMRIDALDARVKAAEAQVAAALRLLPPATAAAPKKERGRPVKKTTTKKKGK